MSEDYWYPFYPFRYQRDTMHLTAEQDGAYRRLIDHYMITKRPLPDNDMALARIAGIDATSNAISMLRAFFKQKSDGFLYHETCERHLKEQATRKMLNKKRAKNAAKKRWEKQDDNANSMPEAMLNDATNTNTNTNTYSDTNVSDESGDSQEVDFKRIIFRDGLKWLAQRTGKTEKQLRPLVGKWCKAGDDVVAGALITAQKQSAVEPISFIEKIISSKYAQNGKAYSHNQARLSKSERVKNALDQSMQELGFE